MIALAFSILFVGSGVLSVVHKPLGCLVPVRTVVLSLLVTVQSVFVKVAVQSWSQSCPIEINALYLSSGKMCVVVAVLGRRGMLSFPSCVEVTMFPFGICTRMGCFVGRSEFCLVTGKK